MATDFLGVDITAKTFPFTQPASFNATRYSTVPWGQAIVNHSFDTPAIAAGNDGSISIDIALPADYVAILRNFYLGIVDTAAVEWTEGMLGMAYQQPGGPYKESVTAYPEDEYTWYQLIGDDAAVRDRFNTFQFYSTFTFGSKNFDTGTFQQLTFDNGWSPTQTSMWVPPSADNSFLERTIVIFLRNKLASQPVQKATIRMSFDLYTFEQAYSAAVMSSPRVFS